MLRRDGLYFLFEEDDLKEICIKLLPIFADDDIDDVLMILSQTFEVIHHSQGYLMILYDN